MDVEVGERRGGLDLVLVGGLIGRSVDVGLVVGVVVGLVVGLAGGLVVGLVRGGTAYLQHYCLRFLLYRSKAMPWHYARFLEEATERILLQPFGGGCTFLTSPFLS